MLRLGANQTTTLAPEANHELALTVITGSVDAAAKDGQRWEGLGGRKSVFDGSTDTLFLPPGTSVELHAVNDCEIAVSQARSDYSGKVALYPAGEAIIEHRGKPGWQREVRTFLSSTANVGRLILGEVASGVSQWTSFPPHKHDVDNLPAEADLEEIYWFRIEPEAGFAFQGLYSPGDESSRNRAYTIYNNDVVAIPDGYHPVAIAPGHRIYYFWVLAGTGHNLKVYVQDDMRWLEPDYSPKS